jgi:hypothetical protein
MKEAQMSWVIRNMKICEISDCECFQNNISTFWFPKAQMDAMTLAMFAQNFYKMESKSVPLNSFPI